MQIIEKYIRSAGSMPGLRFSLLSVLGASAVLGSINAYAQSSPSVTLNFTGTYVLTTCPLISSPDMTVTLPTVSAQSLSEPGAVAGSTPFSITMQCPSGVQG